LTHTKEAHMGHGHNRSSLSHSKRHLAGEIADASTTEHRPLIQQTEKGILIPKGADLSELISELEALHGERTNGSEQIELATTLRVPPWEGAQALVAALIKMFG